MNLDKKLFWVLVVLLSVSATLVVIGSLGEMGLFND